MRSQIAENAANALVNAVGFIPGRCLKVTYPCGNPHSSDVAAAVDAAGSHCREVPVRSHMNAGRSTAEAMSPTTEAT